MATAPTLVSSGTSAYTTTTSPKTVSVSVNAGDIIAVLAGSEDSPNTLSTPTGGAGNTYSLQQSITSSSHSPAYGWTCTCSATASFSVSVARSGGSGRLGCSVPVFRDSDGVGASSSGTGTGAPTLSFTTTQDKSAIVVIITDWNAADGASRSYPTINGFAPTPGGTGEITYARTSGAYAVYAVVYPDAGTAGSKTVGVSTTGTIYSIVAIEIKGTADGGTTIDGEATILGAGAVTASAAVAAKATITGAGAVSGKASLAAKATILGAGAVTGTGSFPATVDGTATILGAGAVSAKATLGSKATVLGAGHVTGSGTYPMLSLTYDTNLSRVRIGGSFGSDDPVTVERSTDQIRWTTVRGGAAATVSSGTLAPTIDDYEFVPDVVNYYRAGGLTASITPELDSIWLKSIARPFLNRAVTIVDYTDPALPSRAGVFDVVGRSLPVAVLDVRGSRRWSVIVRTRLTGATPATTNPGDQLTYDTLEAILRAGDVMLIHTPADCPVPGGYVLIGDASTERRSPRATRRYTTLPCTEVAAPGPDVVGATSTWQTVLDTYATWADLLAANATWGNLLELVGDPTDVIVP